MERFVVGDIVVVPFPFTDLSNNRKRPALILANLKGDDTILCEITSVIRKDDYLVQLDNSDLESGRLKLKSFIRPNRILTIQNNKIIYKFGRIREVKLHEVMDKVRKIFNFS